jgi:hypothetical protein
MNIFFPKLFLKWIKLGLIYAFEMHVYLFWVLEVVERGLTAIDDGWTRPATGPDRGEMASASRLFFKFLATDWTLIS